MFATRIEELMEASSAELDAALDAAELACRRAEAERATVVAVIEAKDSFRIDGCRTMNSFLKGRLNCSGTEANKLRARAALVNQHSEVGDVWVDGHVGTNQIDILSKASSHQVAGDRFTEFSHTLVEAAEHLEHNDFVKAVDHFVAQADPDGTFDDQKFAEDNRSASVSAGKTGVEVRVSGGSALEAAEIDAIFKQAVQAEFEKDCATRRALHGEDHLAHPLPRTLQQRKWGAFYAIFMTSVSVPENAKAPEPIVNLVFDPITAGHVMVKHGLADNPDLFDIGRDLFAAAEADLTGRRCSTSDGTPVHPDIVLKAMLRGRVRRAIIDSNNVTINLGRAQRLFTGKAREAAQLMVATCVRRGCDVPAELCDIDHLVEYEDGGATDQANSGPTCGVDNRWKHLNKIRTRRATNGRIYLIRPDDTVIKPVGERDPVWAEPVPKPPPDQTA